jgi:hypothetical protein
MLAVPRPPPPPAEPPAEPGTVPALDPATPGACELPPSSDGAQARATKQTDATPSAQPPLEVRVNRRRRIMLGVCSLFERACIS